MNVRKEVTVYPLHHPSPSEKSLMLNDNEKPICYLHGLLQRGGRVCFLRPHGTVSTVNPQWHFTSAVNGHG